MLNTETIKQAKNAVQALKKARADKYKASERQKFLIEELHLLAQEICSSTRYNVHTTYSAGPIKIFTSSITEGVTFDLRKADAIDPFLLKLVKISAENEKEERQFAGELHAQNLLLAAALNNITDTTY